MSGLQVVTSNQEKGSPTVLSLGDEKGFCYFCNSNNTNMQVPGEKWFSFWLNYDAFIKLLTKLFKGIKYH